MLRFIPDCFGSADVALLVEASSWNRDFNDVKVFLTRFVETIRPCFGGAVRFALVKYGAEVATVATFRDSAQMKSSIISLTTYQEYDSDLGQALRTTQQQVFSQSNDGAKKVMVVFSSYGLYNTRASTHEVAAGLHRAGYIIGIFAWQYATDRVELDGVASSDSLIISGSQGSVFATVESQSAQFLSNLRNEVGSGGGPPPGITPAPPPGITPAPPVGPPAGKSM